MSFGKKDITKEISSKAHISSSDSSAILKSFINLFKFNKFYLIKITNFGTFRSYKTSSRIGRNPMTGEEFDIKPRQALNFRASNKIKKLLN